MIEINYIPSIKFTDLTKDCQDELMKEHKYFQAFGIMTTVIELEETPLLKIWVGKNLDTSITEIVVKP